MRNIRTSLSLTVFVALVLVTACGDADSATGSSVDAVGSATDGAASSRVSTTSVSAGAPTLSPNLDESLRSSLDGDVLSISYSSPPGDRSMYFSVAQTADEDENPVLVGYLLSGAATVGSFVPWESDDQLMPDGVVSGGGPDQFDVGPLKSDAYVACIELIDKRSVKCVEFAA